MKSKESKALLLEELYAPYKKCKECPLGFLGRKNVVFGSGNPDATFMIIGEAPGRDEDEQGLPFVGRSGKLLTKVLNLVGIERKDIFITNSVKCRPPENRKPLPIETKTCKDLLLLHQINIIKPKVICTLGATALECLFEKPVKLSDFRGKKLVVGSITIIPTYHPSYILRAPEKLKILMEDIEAAYSICNK
ncbi:MAG TPA: uracil-DNA glycosylase [Candidatus Babeliales bacterium]|jgi:uracil-DNA glycosylase family 4|nr:uracil-DNA glycosylase [Candidatus Babeliales bacterium]